LSSSNRMSLIIAFGGKQIFNEVCRDAKKMS
jgi:hypothetical protein